MCRVFYQLFLVVSGLILSVRVQAQFATSGLDLGNNIGEWYDQTVGKDNLQILQGAYFPILGQTRNEHQYYKEIDWALGSIVFDGKLYQNIELLYNSFSDRVLVRNISIHVANDQPVLLNQVFIESFTIHDDQFVSLRDDRSSLAGSGFYHHFYNGDQIDLLVKRAKIKNIKSKRVSYAEEDQYFISYQNQYTRFKGKKTFYDLFPSKKTQLKAYFNKNIPYSERKLDSGLQKMLAYCDQLISDL